MSRKGTVGTMRWLSFFKTLKTEQFIVTYIKDQMILDIFEYIKIMVQQKRRHSALEYKT
jgi:hypothetical protein